MAKTKQEWLYQLRRCSSVNTLEKIIHKNRDSLSTSERESFNSAADHRLAELISESYMTGYQKRYGNM